MFRPLSARLGHLLPLVLAAVLAPLAGCATPAPPPACPVEPLPSSDAVWAVAHGWHTDLAIPAASLRGPMMVFRRIFPGLKVLLVGYGKRTFMMAPVTTSGDLVLGPFPGSGTVLIAGLSGPPDQAYADGTEAMLPLPPGGAERLSRFVWRTLQTQGGMPVKIGDGFFPGSIFYGARTGYSGFNTCNSWAADALHAAGLPLDPFGVVFAGQVMRRAGALAPAGVCAIHGKPG